MKKVFIIIGKVVAGIVGIITAILAIIGTGRVVEERMSERNLLDATGESLKKTKNNWKRWISK